ncbi:glycoprotein, partial [Coleopteran phasma-related virus OKIAV235]
KKKTNMNNYILFTLLSFMILVESKIVVVEHGEITITEDTNCTFNCNGITIQSKSGKVPGLWFGFIEYNCSNIMGSIISNFECKQCGLFCVYNQIIPGCSQDAFLIVIGVIIGSIIMLPFIILIAVKWHLFFDFILSKIIMLKTKMTIDKKFRRAKKYGKMTGNKVRIDVEVGNNLMKEADKERVSNHRGKVLNKLIGKGIEMKDDNYDIIKDAKENIFPMRNFDPSIIVELSETIRTGSMIRESRLRKLDVPASAPEYITVVDKPSTSKRPDTPPRIHSRRNSSSDMINRKKMMAALTAGILLGTPGSHACDKSIYINSAGRICDVNNCYDTPMASFPLTTGQLICYKDVNGSIFNIKITNAYYRDRYQLLYYTSDYEIKYDTYRRCLGTDECGPNKNCYKGSIGSRFNTNESKIEGYDCFDGEYSCDNFCFRQATCSWVKWWLLDDKIMYPVYIKVTSIWEVELMITYHNIKKIVKVNVNNPTIDVSDFNSLGLKDIPIYVNGFTSEVISIPNGIIIHDSKAYITKVSELNMPETNIIGDYQISIDGSNKIYDTNSIICRTTQCTTKC